MKGAIVVNVTSDSLEQTKRSARQVMEILTDVVARELYNMDLEFDCGFNPQEIAVAEC